MPKVETKPCPRGMFRCEKCQECVPLSIPFEKHIGPCSVTQAKKARAAKKASEQRGRHAR